MLAIHLFIDSTHTKQALSYCWAEILDINIVAKLSLLSMSAHPWRGNKLKASHFKTIVFETKVRTMNNSVANK